jgi:hypothetical protein
MAMALLLRQTPLLSSVPYLTYSTLLAISTSFGALVLSFQTQTDARTLRTITNTSDNRVNPTGFPVHFPWPNPVLASSAREYSTGTSLEGIQVCNSESSTRYLLTRNDKLCLNDIENTCISIDGALVYCTIGNQLYNFHITLGIKCDTILQALPGNVARTL